MRPTWSITVLSVFAIRQAAATLSWGSDKCFPNPSNCNNVCSHDQKAGYDWGDLPTGDFSSFDDFDFSGFSCHGSCGKGAYQGKCIEGKIYKGPSGDALSISHGKDKPFSITSFQITVSVETEVSFVYGMPDGSTCKHTTPCSSEGSEIKNTQCGGATSVVFVLPHYSYLDECDFGIHHIEFDCNPPEVTTQPPPIVSSTSSVSSAPPSSETAPPYSSSAVSSPVSSAEESSETPAPSTYVSSSSASSTEGSSETLTPPTYVGSSSASSAEGSSETPAPSTYASSSSVSEETSPAPPEGSYPDSSTPVSLTTSTVFTTTVVTITSCGLNVTYCPAGNTQVITSTIAISTTVCPVTEIGSTPPSTPISTDIPTTPSPTAVSTSSSAELPISSPSDVVVTEVTFTTVTTCPVTSIVTSGSSQVTLVTSTVSTLTLISTTTVCTQCAYSSAIIPISSNPAPPPPTPSAPCPVVVPQCLNTWLNLVPDCSSNSDISCFCPSSEFTSAVIACIQSWGVSDSEIQSALSYFAGICVAQVPQNPGIITAVPSTITIGIPTGGYTAAPPTAVPLTTVTVCQTISNTITDATSTIVVTLPQVTLITAAASGPTAATSIALIPGTVPVTGAYTGATPPVLTTLATVPNTQGASASYPVPAETTSVTPFTGGAASLLCISSGIWLLPAVAALGITGFFR